MSSNRKAINWKLVITGIALQVVFALLILKVDFVYEGFRGVADFFVQVLNFTEAGSKFVLGDWPNVVQVSDGITGKVFTVGYIFAIKVLPTIIFFSALSSLLYYLGILQKIVWVFAWIMSKTMSLSGAESLSAAANIFIGQTEAPLVVKPYLEDMTKSEILCLMTGGMATIAGGVLAAYIGFLGGGDEEMELYYATHLLSASIMSAPAAIVAAKMIEPETEKVNQNLDVSKDRIGSNVLDAVTNGTTDGLRLAVNVGAMLLVFTAFMAMFNYISLNWIGEWTGLNEQIVSSTSGRYGGLTLQYLLGQVFSPIAWLLGVPYEDITLIGQLLGEKTILNEFFAYASLGELKAAGTIANEKSIIIATYALCGFANFASIGIQIGGIGAIAPGQRKVLSQFGIKALVGGTIAAFLTATIAGVIV